MSFNNGEMVGAYRILEQLGQGGMATVFKAYHAALDRYVALKVLHPALLEDKNFLSRFQREARVVAKLEHPNIVPVHDFAEHEGQPYLVMKFIEGETLKARLQEGNLSLDEIPRIVETVGDALSYAHRQGILHRDIKPSNVMMANDGHIYLADFGLARIAGAGESTLTSDMIVGTPQYISPEQATGKKDLDEGTDIYSFGVMLYELVVGRVPFSADTPYAVIHAHIYSPLPLPSMVNPKIVPEMERMLLKALAKDRQDRFKDISELVRAFKEAWEAQAAALLAVQEHVSVPEAETIPPAVLEPSAPPTVMAEPEPEVPLGPHSPLETGANVGKKPRNNSSSGLWIVVVLLLILLGALVFSFNRSIKIPKAVQTLGVTVFASQTTQPVSRVPATNVPPVVYPPGVLFQANFDNDKLSKDWNTESGWGIRDGALCGNGHFFTRSAQSNWRDYIVSFGLKVDKGFIHLNLRQTADGGLKRYFISFTPGSGMGLNKQVDQTFTNNLAGLEYNLEQEKWYDVQLVAQGQRILALVDGIIVLDYVDSQALPAGGISFETLDSSSACIDNLVVTDLTGKPKFDLLNEQNFEGQTALPGWQLMDGAGKPNNAWSVQAGAFCGSGHNWAIFRELNLTNFNARFRLSMKNGSLHVNFNIHDQPPWRYRLWMGVSGSNVSLTRDYSGKEKLLVTGRAGILPLKWYDVRVSLINGRVQMWINEKRIFDFTDKDPLGSGFIGFESLDDAHNVCIDDLIVTKPSLAQTPLESVVVT